MTTVLTSTHAQSRMQQRGLRPADLELVLAVGSLVSDDVYFLSRADVDREILERQSEIRALQRLRNQKVVMTENTIVTCYRSRPWDQRNMLRKAREQNAVY